MDTISDAKQYGATGYFGMPLKLAEVHSRIRAFLREAAA